MTTGMPPTEDEALAMTTGANPTTDLPINFKATAVTHRLVRHVKREADTTVCPEGSAPYVEHETYYEAVCACGYVFTADTDNGAAGKYLAHLPHPK